MTARDDVLRAASALSARSPDGTFTVQDIVQWLHRHGSAYTEGTIRTHVTSRMCSDAPANHGTVYDDLKRIGEGRYALNRQP